jgi:hypothetical protein
MFMFNISESGGYHGAMRRCSRLFDTKTRTSRKRLMENGATGGSESSGPMLLCNVDWEITYAGGLFALDVVIHPAFLVSRSLPLDPECWNQVVNGSHSMFIPRGGHVANFGIPVSTIHLHLPKGLFQVLVDGGQSHVRAVCLRHQVEA